MPVPLQQNPKHNQPEYSVSEISTALKRTVEDSFGYVRVRGEISGFKRAASGHLYMDLKDDKAVLNAVCWRGNAGKMTFKPEDGLEVICSGKLTTYPGRSNYQIVIESMEPAGEGALMALLEKRKKELAAEGLFDASRKKEKPFMPQLIGVVTSPTGAVIRDILHRISDRFPVHVLVWPVKVQGEGAAAEIAAAIRGFNGLLHPPELLIVARGGGSMEDLWCFNEEVVVRAAADSHIPLISAVGHETDTTLIDYVADVRAPTPTAAAEMAVPVRLEWVATLDQWGGRLNQRMLQQLQQRHERVEGLARGIPNPSQLLAYATQRLDDWNERLRLSLPAYVDKKSQRLQLVLARLKPQDLKQRLVREEEKLQAYRLDMLVARVLRDKQDVLHLQNKLFETLNYRNVLKRGFALVKRSTGELVASASSLSSGDAVQLMFADGEVSAVADGGKAKGARPRRIALKDSDEQSSLF